MSLIFWKRAVVEPFEADRVETEVNERHPFPTGLYYRPPNSGEYVEVDLSAGLPVIVTDQVGPGRMQVWDIPIQVSTSAYAANDAVGQLLTFPDAARTPTGKGSIVSASLTDLTDQGAAMNLVLFNAPPLTPTADNAAMAIPDADARSAFGGLVWATTDYVDFGGFRVATIRNQWLGYVCRNGALYGQLMTSGTPTYAIGDLRLILVALWD